MPTPLASAPSFSFCRYRRFDPSLPRIFTKDLLDSDPQSGPHKLPGEVAPPISNNGYSAFSVSLPPPRHPCSTSTTPSTSLALCPDVFARPELNRSLSTPYTAVEPSVFCTLVPIQHNCCSGGGGSHRQRCNPMSKSGARSIHPNPSPSFDLLAPYTLSTLASCGRPCCSQLPARPYFRGHSFIYSSPTPAEPLLNPSANKTDGKLFFNRAASFISWLT